MRNRFHILVVLAAVLLAAVACSRVPDGVLPKEKMASLLADIHIGESVVESNGSKFPDDSLKRAFRQSIFARHGVTSEEVDSSLRWYGYNMEKYVEVYDRVLEILDERLVAAQENASSTGQSQLTGTAMSLEGDSVDVWYELRFRPFAYNLPSDRIRFFYPSDLNWEKGDVYTFRSKITGTGSPAEFIVGVEYIDGSTEHFTQLLHGDGWHEIRFALDSARNAREFFGELRYPSRGSEIAFVDSIQLIRTRWNPSKRPARDVMKSMKIKRRTSRFD